MNMFVLSAMQVLRRVSKCKQYLQVVKTQYPNFFILDFHSHYDYQCRNYCNNLLETGSRDSNSYGPNSEIQYHPASSSSSSALISTMDSEEDAEGIYNRIYEFIDEKKHDEGNIVDLPAGWLLSMVQRCKTYHDIKLLFFLLLHQQLLIKTPDAHLTKEVTRACLRCGALLHARMTMCNTNTYGFTPNNASALLLLKYAEDDDDAKFMKQIFCLIQINNLPLDPDVAEIILRICRNVKCLKRLYYYANKFISNGVKLHQSSYELLMEIAADKGDVDSLNKFEIFRSYQISEFQTNRSGLAYAKGFLLNGDPKGAANVILEIFYQHNSGRDVDDYPERPWPEELIIEIQKLVDEWPRKVINLRMSAQEKEERVATLKSCIPQMMEYLEPEGQGLYQVDLTSLNVL